jgi:hypothetical protein
LHTTLEQARWKMAYMRAPSPTGHHFEHRPLFVQGAIHEIPRSIPFIIRLPLPLPSFQWVSPPALLGFVYPSFGHPQMTPAAPLMPMSPAPVYMYGGVVGTPMVSQPTAVAGPTHPFFMPMARQGTCTEVNKEWTVRRSVTAKAALSKSDAHGDTPVEDLLPAENEHVNEDASMPSTKTTPYEEDWSKTEAAPMAGAPRAQEPEETRGMLSCCRFLQLLPVSCSESEARS